MKEAELLTPRQQQARVDALVRRGKQIQDGQKQGMRPPPGRDPKTRGISPADQAEAHRNFELRQAEKEAYAQRVREEEKARRAIAAKEARVAEKVARYESELRAKAGLPERG